MHPCADFAYEVGMKIGNLEVVRGGHSREQSLRLHDKIFALQALNLIVGFEIACLNPTFPLHPEGMFGGSFNNAYFTVRTE